MRRLTIGMMATLVALAVAGAASAAPSISLTWESTTGTGTTGGSSIDAAPGDVLRLSLKAVADANGLTFTSQSLSWDAADLLGQSAAECSALDNAFPGFCSDGGGPAPPFHSPFTPGVAVGAGSASSFDAGGLAVFAVSINVGTIEFTVQPGAGVEIINIDYSLAPGIDSTNDGGGGVFFPTASASIVVPEPGTAALLGLGLGALGFLGRRRS